MEQEYIHAWFEWPDSRHMFEGMISKHVGEHSSLLHTNKQEWRRGIFRFLSFYRVRNFLQKTMDSESWEEFLTESSAKLLKTIASWNLPQFILHGFHEKCICREGESIKSKERRRHYKHRDMYRTVSDQRRLHADYGIHTEQELEERVRLSTSFQNAKRIMKWLQTFADVSSLDNERDIISVIGRWVKAEVDSSWSSGRDRNICFSSLKGRTGKTWLVEFLMALFNNFAAASHLVLTSHNSSFAFQGSSRERSHRYNTE